MTSPEAATRLWFDSMSLAMEASSVIWLRSWRMMAGGALAEREGQRMVDEKLAAAATFWPAMMMAAPFSPAAFGTQALAHYAKPVRANRRRLSRSG
ncbi:hypothetical protein A6F65_00957 [Paraurantiacibacter namhicola]|uniref:Uncharacterized protein n=2 Tax=Paraurantiacibacter namhicola TaxID=645517 RepID=A0A1C7D743_9SPHN|nr:hypothetical protein A6F65_00957 [Paraurantiacibacter namhicola]